MTHEGMLQLIEQSGLELVSCYPHRRYYGLCLELNGRFQNDELSFTREEFEALTTEQAQEKIEYVRADMDRAAKTVSGLLKREMKQTKKVNSDIGVNDVKSKDSDTDRYLRNLKKRGELIAKRTNYKVLETY
jgi:hypothetical protein